MAPCVFWRSTDCPVFRKLRGTLHDDPIQHLRQDRRDLFQPFWFSDQMIRQQPPEAPLLPELRLLAESFHELLDAVAEILVLPLNLLE